MNEEDLNIKYIREKTGLVENDELIPIILEMIQESYKVGLCQAEYDNTMDLIEENQQLKEQLELSEKAINDARMYVCRVGMKSIVGIHEWFIKEIIKDTISGEPHLGTNLKEQCLMYFDNLISENQQYREVIDRARVLVNNVYNSLENPDKPIKFYEELLNILTINERN